MRLRLVEMTMIIPTRIEWGFISLFILDGEHRWEGGFCAGEAADGFGHAADKVGRRGTGLLGLQGLAEHTFLTEGLILGIADIEQRPSIEENQAGRLDDGLLQRECDTGLDAHSDIITIGELAERLAGYYRQRMAGIAATDGRHCSR